MKNLIFISSLLLICANAFSQEKSTQPSNQIQGNQTQGTTTYAIKRHTISSGGGVMTDSGNVYQVTGVIGQIDAGHNATQSPYVFKGGFLHGSASPNSGDIIFKNGFE
ncbi:MAG: hypothetical protein ACWA5R_11275 [bacterium]